MAEGLKANSTLTNLSLATNGIADEGAKAWCLVWMVRTKDIARSKIRALESEVSEMLKRSERNAECSLTMFSILPAKGDLKISTAGGGTPKRRYIGPQR